MNQYRVYFNASASTFVDVYAVDKDQAIEKAYAEDKPYSCHQCPQLEQWEYEGDSVGFYIEDQYYRGVEELSK